METENDLDQMAKFDFNAKIDVEILFEDSDDDDLSIKNELSEPENTKENNNNKHVETECKNDKKGPEINHRGSHKPVLCLNKTNRILKEKPAQEISGNNAINYLNNSKNAEISKNTDDVGHCLHQSESYTGQHALILIGNDAVNNEETLPSTLQINDHPEPANTFVEDLLSKLSDHIVLIMQSFYHYGVRNYIQDNNKKEERFHFIKHHFFELSYNIMESIILPQEYNNGFINKFLDDTVILANSKFQQWKCHKGHVQQFFNELVRWTKQRREQIKGNYTPCHSHSHVTLTQLLNKPPLSLNPQRSGIIANSNVATPKTPNLCIFTSGTPGQEISINIDADTFLRFTDNDQFNTSEQNGNRNNYAPSGEYTRRNTPVPRPTYGNSVHDMQKNISHNRPPPPPYRVNHCSQMRHGPQQCNKKNVNSIRNHQYHHGNMGQHRQNHQNTGQPIYNYQTQVQCNTRQILPPPNYSSNYLLYDDTNNNIPMHQTRTENLTTFNPVITNVSSLNPRTRILNIRCHMCGKNTTTQCAPTSTQYNPSCRTTYCSYLCKELDSQFYKPACGNT